MKKPVGFLVESRLIVVFFAALILLTIFAGSAFGALDPGVERNPFKLIWTAIYDLQGQVASLFDRTGELSGQLNATGKINQTVINVTINMPPVNNTPEILSFDAFLKIDSIDGESTDDKHKDWIEVLSYSHGMSVPFASGGGGATGKSEHQEFVITKQLDKSSPNLALALNEGKHITGVTLEIVRSLNGTRETYMEYKLENVLISSIIVGGRTMGDAVPSEQVSFNYAKIKWTYTSKTGEKVVTGWDIAASKKL